MREGYNDYRLLQPLNTIYNNWGLWLHLQEKCVINHSLCLLCHDQFSLEYDSSFIVFSHPTILFTQHIPLNQLAH